MAVYDALLNLRTAKKFEAMDVTDLVARAVAESGIKKGICTLFVPHTTAGISANEHFDPNVPHDILTTLAGLVPEDASYGHPEGNAPAHIKASIVGSSLCVPVREGQLALGRWQGIYLMEFDGPRSRQMHVTVIG